jgi:hypothetical protein
MDEPAVIVLGPCFVCRRPFTFNPHRVPSYDPSLDDPVQAPGRRPICESCIVAVNARRKARGLDEWPVFPDSYEPISSSEL